MAVAESLMNIAASDLLDGLKRVRLSCNWMTAIVRIVKSRVILCFYTPIRATRYALRRYPAIVYKMSRA